MKRYFFYPRRKDANAFIQKISIRTKSLAIVYFYDITVQQYHKTSPGKNYLLGFTLPRCGSHCSPFYHGINQNINVMSQFLQVR